MIKVKDKFPRHEDGSLDIELWLQKIQTTYSLPSIDLLKHACELAASASKGLTTFYGQPCLEQGIEMAEMVLALKLDQEAVAAAIVFSTAQQAHLSHEAISKQLGEPIWKLVSSVLQLNVINSMANNNQIDTLRKTLLAMASDIRVVLIKLAERAALMRGIKHINIDERKRLAQETTDLYAPLANRLGIGQLKWELEDLAFHYLNPETYKTIAGFLAEKRGDRENRIKEIVAQLKEKLIEAHIQADVTGRAKHIYSIYLKKQRKQVDYQNIFDYSAVRILVPTLQDCYTALSITHHLWEQIPAEFDDYIANPKPNGYRSIHTAVIGPGKKNLEIQIRTYEMHEQSEHGIAAHWQYKEDKKQQADYQEKITYLRQLLAWQGDVTPDQPKKITDILADRAYVFTPKGDIIDLPMGATPLDFAYHIHSEVGHRCRGAKVNGHIVHLNHVLHTGDRIELLTAAAGNPSRDWLNPELGYLKSSRARAKVSQWFRHQETSLHLEEAKEQEIPRKKIEKPEAPISIHSLKKSLTPEAGLQIVGVNDLLTRIARCCKPIPGDNIIGFITLGRGVSIHRRNCTNIAHIPDHESRLVNVSWDSKHPGGYYADIYIRAYGRDTLLKDITNLLTTLKINLVALNSTVNQKNNVIHITMTTQIHDADQLKQLLSQLHQLKSIIEIKRMTK